MHLRHGLLVLLAATAVAGCGGSSGSSSSTTPRRGLFAQLTSAQRTCLQKAGFGFGGPGGRRPGQAPPNGTPPGGGAPPSGGTPPSLTAAQRRQFAARRKQTQAVFQRCGIKLPTGVPGS